MQEDEVNRKYAIDKSVCRRKYVLLYNNLIGCWQYRKEKRNNGRKIEYFI